MPNLFINSILHSGTPLQHDIPNSFILLINALPQLQNNLKQALPILTQTLNLLHKVLFLFYPRIPLNLQLTLQILDYGFPLP